MLQPTAICMLGHNVLGLARHTHVTMDDHDLNLTHPLTQIEQCEHNMRNNSGKFSCAFMFNLKTIIHAMGVYINWTTCT